MTELQQLRAEAVRYWESRRVFYNLVLTPFALAGFFFGGLLPGAVGDPVQRSAEEVVSVFIGSVIAANLCYSSAYVLEFFLGSTDVTTWWPAWGRRLLFSAGVLLSMILTLIWSTQIGSMVYVPKNQKPPHESRCPTNGSRLTVSARWSTGIPASRTFCDR